MNVIFVEALAKCFTEAGWNNTAEDSDITILIGYRGHLFRMAKDFSITEAAQGFDAEGSGRPVAIGSLYATTTLKPRMKSKEHLKIALEAADKHSVDVRKPFKFVGG